jgi:solute carrier family 25 2-oxodicarboxylate transporter 21
MSAELVGMIPKNSAMYSTYEYVRQKLAVELDYGDTSLVASFSGLCAGIPEALIVTPSQVIKVRLQAKEHLGKYNGPIDCISKVYRNEGLGGFFTGLGPTLFRNCVWNTVYFGTMHWGKKLLPKAHSREMDLLQTFFSGFFGAVFATCFNAPFDVVKSRFQSQIPSTENGQALRYRGTFQTLHLVYTEEGLAACYKGFQPKAIRMGLGGAVGMMIFELSLLLL